MMELEVLEPVLNIRSTPVADSSYANWIGDMNQGEKFYATDIVSGEAFGNDNYWFKDQNNRYVISNYVASDDHRVGWGMNALGIPAIWNYTKGSGINVAILDTGLDITNVDLISAVKSGYNAITDKYYSANDPTCINDTCGHGTNCASIVGARGTNGIIGVAPESNLIIIKIAENNADLSVNNRIAAGIEKAIELGANIISISAEYPQEDGLVSSTIEKYWDKCCFIASAGNNSGFVGYPADTPGMISVNAFQTDNEKAGYKAANYSIADLSATADVGEKEGITICAPGEDIIVYGLNNTQHLFQGTSAAAPFVAGVSALLLAYTNTQLSSSKITNHSELRQRLINSAFQAPSDPNLIRIWGNGIIDPIKLIIS